MEASLCMKIFRNFLEDVFLKEIVKNSWETMYLCQNLFLICCMQGSNRQLSLKRDSCIDIFLPTLFPDIFNQIHWKEALLTSSIQKYFTCKIYDILVSEIIHFEIFSCLQENQLGRKYFVKFNLLLFFLISQCWECFMVLCIYSGV